MRTVLTILFSLCILTAKAQEAIVISGIVRDAKTHDALDAVNIMLQSADGKLMYGFALTNEQGNYSIKYNNLQLKSTSSGIWNESAQAGLGYKPAIWDAEATAMHFGRKFQNLSLYKTNNTGNDISGELTSHYSDDEEDGLPILSGIHKPSTPSINKQRYLDNDIHLVSTNAINKLKEGLTLTTNAYYMHDSQNSQSESATTYYLPTSQVLIISEATDACHRTDRTGVNMSIEKNTEAFYVKDKVEFSGEWVNDKGNVTNETSPVTQYYKRSNIAFKNVFEGIRKIGNLSFNLSSITDYSSAPTTLSVTPMLFPEIFKNTENISGAVQQLDNKRFRTRNSIYTSFAVKNEVKFRLNYIPYTTFTNYPKGCITEENRIPYSAILQGSLQVVVYTDSSRRMEHTL